MRTRLITGFMLGFTAAVALASATQAQVSHSLDQNQPAPTTLQIQNAIPMERTIDPAVTPPGQSDSGLVIETLQPPPGVVEGNPGPDAQGQPQSSKPGQPE